MLLLRTLAIYWYHISIIDSMLLVSADVMILSDMITTTVLSGTTQSTKQSLVQIRDPVEFLGQDLRLLRLRGSSERWNEQS